MIEVIETIKKLLTSEEKLEFLGNEYPCLKIYVLNKLERF